MADLEHVGSKNKDEKSSIFSLFAKLLASSKTPEKSCVLLFDALKWDDRKVGSSDALTYVTKRLVRGLASTQTKRQSLIFSALTSALQHNVITVEGVLSVVDSEVKNNGPSTSEQGLTLTITVLTCGAIIKSGKFSSIPSKTQGDVIKRLVVFGSQKQYLRNATSAFFVELLRDMSKEVFKAAVWPVVKEHTNSCKELNDEWFAVLFLSAWSFPKVTDSFVSEKFENKNKLCEEVLPRCAYYPLIVQDEVLSLLQTSLSREPKELLRRWKMIVSHEHKITPKWSYFILNFCKKILDSVENPALIVKILRPEVAKFLLLSSKKCTQKSDGNDFQALCKSVLEIITKRLTAVEVDKKLSLKVLKLFLLDGDLNFDRMTKTRTVHLLLENLDAECVKILLSELTGILDGASSKTDASGNKVEWSSRERQFFLPVFNSLLSHPSLQKDVAVNLANIKFLFEAGFLKSSKMNSDLRRHARDTFFKAVELRNFKMDSAVLLLNDLIMYIDSKLNELSADITESARGEWNNVLTANAKFMKNVKDKKFTSVRLLLLHMGLFLFRDAELASSTIKELLQCYNRIQSDRESKKSKNTTEGEEPHWVEVTVDLLLALLSRENKLLRHVVNSVFPSMAPYLTPTALQQIVDALDPAARNDVLKHIDSDNSDDEDEDDGEDIEDSEDSGLEDEETERETVNDKLRMAVRNALGYSATMTDDESVDMDQMNEDEEERLNESLANAFRMFRSSKGSKKKQSKDDEALTHFRIRVLDLIEVIVSTNPALATCLDLLSPLLALLELAIKDPHLKPLQNRLESVLKRMGGAKKFDNVKQVSYKTVVELFTGMFEREASGLVYAEMAPALTECAGVLVRASQLIQLDPTCLSLEDCYINLLDRFFKNNDRKVPYSVFPSVLRMLWDGNWKISKHIMSLLLDHELKLFKKVRLLDLLEVFYRNDRLQSTATDDRKTALSTSESKFVKKFANLLANYNQQISKTKMIATFYTRVLQIIQLMVSSLTKYRNDCPTVPQWNIVIEQLIQCPDLFQQQRTKARLVNLAQMYDIPVPTVPKRAEPKHLHKPQEDKIQVESNEKKKRKRKVSAGQTSIEEDVELVEGRLENGGVEKKRKRKASIGHRSVEEGLGTIAEIKPMKKKKHSNKGAKMAKEARELREAASSQGIESVSFSSVQMENIQDEDDDEKRPVLLKKKNAVGGKKKKKSNV